MPTAEMMVAVGGQGLTTSINVPVALTEAANAAIVSTLPKDLEAMPARTSTGKFFAWPAA